MPVAWTKVSMPLGGIDAKTDPALVLPGKLLDLQNGRHRRLGAIEKRPGYELLTNARMGAGTHGAPRRILSTGDELLLFDDGQLQSYMDSPVTAWNVRSNQVPRFLLDRRPIGRTDANFTLSVTPTPWPNRNPDADYTNGHIGYAWSDRAEAIPTVRFLIQDRATRTVLGVRTVTVIGFFPPYHVVARNGLIHLLFINDAGTLVRLTWNTSTASFGAVTAVVVGVGTLAGFDVVQLRSNIVHEILLVYPTPGVGGSVTVQRWVHDFSALLAGTTFADSHNNEFAIYGSEAATVWIAYGQPVAGETRFRLFATATLAPLAGPVTVDTVMADKMSWTELDTTRAALAWFHSSYLTTWTVVTSPTGVFVPALSMERVFFPARLFTHNGKACMTVVLVPAPPDETKLTTYLYEITDEALNPRAGRLLASYAREQSISTLSSRDPVCHSMEPAPGIFDLAIGVQTSLASKKSGIDRVTLDAASIHRYQSCRWGDGLFVAGACPSLYDSQILVDGGHTELPNFTTNPALVAGGVLTSDPSNLYRWILVFEWTDSKNRLHRSAPSFARAAAAPVVAPNLSVSISIPKYLRGNKNGDTLATTVRAIVYRNTVAQPTLFNRVGDATPGGTFVDGDNGTEADVEIIKNESLYTTGGILDNSGWPACKVCALHNGRIWIAGLEEPDEIRFTKGLLLGVAPEFNENLSVRIPGGAEVTALASMDDTLIAFTQSALYAVRGDGPPPTGLGGINLEVRQITADAGSAEPESIVTTPLGLMFRSAKGIYLLGRNFSVSKAGALVERILESWPIVVGATLRRDFTEVQFAVRNDLGLPPLVGFVTYDYLADAWSTDTFATNMAPVTATEHKGSIVFGAGQPFPRVFREHGLFMDNEFPFGLVIETPNVALDTIAGWQRTRSVTLLADRVGSHGLTFEVASNDDGFIVVSSFTQSELDALSREQVRVRVPSQKAKSVRVRVTENPGAIANAGPRLRALVFEAGMKQGTTKLPAAAKR